MDLSYSSSLALVWDHRASLSAQEGMGCSKTPVLFIHGTDGHFVPVEMTCQNYCACASPKRLLIVPGADHGMSFLADPESCKSMARNFWKELDGQKEA